MNNKLTDRRYNALKSYIESGSMQHFREIFDIVPRARWVEDTGINWTRLANKINNPEKFTTKDIIIIANIINVEDAKLWILISAAVDKKKLLKKKAKTNGTTKNKRS